MDVPAKLVGQALTVAQLRDYLNGLDSAYDHLPVGRCDGTHEYWGTVNTKVCEVGVRNEQIDGPKKNGMDCLYFE